MKIKWNGIFYYATNGEISEIKIWDVALTGEQVTSMHEHPDVPVETDHVIYESK